MDLPNLFSAGGESVNKSIICVVLSDSSVQSLLLNISFQGTRILERSKVIPYTDEANCLIKTDESLQGLGKESEKVNEVLFGLEQAWLVADGISEEKKSLLHKISTDLSLKPVGYVVQTEALYQHYLSHNIHASIILIVFSEQYITLVVVAQGQMKLTESVGRSADIVADIKEALARYGKKYENTYLPGKFVCASFVLGEPELTSYQQTLLDVTWSDQFPFVQKPVVDVMRPDLAMTLIAQQAGQAIAASMIGTGVATPLMAKETASASATADELGFSQVSPEQFKRTNEEDMSATAQSNVSSFGIPIKSNLASTHFDQRATAVHNLDADDEELAIIEKKPSWWKELVPNMASGSRPAKTHSIKKMIFIGASAGLVALIAIASIFIYFFSQVTAVIVPKSVPITKEVQLTIDPKAQVSDPQNLLIPGELVSKTVTVDHEIETTGVKIVGDKAKGEVTIYNKTQAEKKFAAGTVIKFGEIEFTADGEITVPAAVENGDSLKYGEQKAAVTAFLIGVEGNISKDKDLIVADFDKNTYSAISTVDFSGGSSREIRVVAQEDLDTALTEAKQVAFEEANTAFADDSQNGTYILPTSTIEVKDSRYSAELEQEAEKLSVTLSAQITGLSYQVDDLKPLATQLLASEIPVGYEIDSQDPQILSSPAESVDSTDKVALTANISTTALPTLEENKIKQSIAGKPIEEAQTILQSTQGIKSATFVFYPSWAQAVITSIPTALERITIEKIKE